MIKAAGLSFSYDPHGAEATVNRATIDVAEHEVLGIVGPNGSGKTTLLRLLSGTLQPSKGVVDIDHRPLKTMKPGEIARQISVVIQEHEMASGLTVAEMTMLGRTPHLGAFERSKELDHSIVEASLHHVDMLPKARRPFDGLSGGERQRVLIARALAQQTPYLFLDEPTNHLDIRFQHEVLDLVRGLEKTVVVILHDLNLAARYCDRIAMMSKGEIISQGCPRDVLTEDRIEAVYQVRTERLETATGLHLLFQPLIHAEARHS